VLQVNKFYYLRGGAERYYFDLTDALRARGHEVIPFAMQDPRNEPTLHEASFAAPVDFHSNGSVLGRVRRGARVVYNVEARRRLSLLIDRFRPDVAHLHNVAHQLTPSILDALRGAKIPVVQTLHDYKLICSSYLLFANGAVCDRCRGGRHYHAAFQRCHHGSLGMSVVGFVEMAVHAARGSYDSVARFLCPSGFMKSKCESFGVGGDRLQHLPYFLKAERYRPSYEAGDYVLYAGRLSREKGVSALLRAVARLREIPLVVVGDGPLRQQLEIEAAASGAPVRFEGHLDTEALHARVRGAAFVVVPSEWYENLPYAILEAFALGKPVLGSRIGGIPELVRESETGALFEARDAEALAEVLNRMWRDRGRLVQMGRAARARIEREFDESGHLEQVGLVYRSLAA
jgi:glycosyltransferase involved in cell wall biosynthesis